MSLFERGRPPLHLAAHGDEEAVDVTGAGDTVAATYAAAIAAGATRPSRPCGSPTWPASLVGPEGRDGHGDRGRDPARAARGRDGQPAPHRRTSPRSAPGPAAAGKTIALANGIFDLFHVGHLRYLEGAKALGRRAGGGGEQRRLHPRATRGRGGRWCRRPSGPRSWPRSPASTTSWSSARGPWCRSSASSGPTST